MTTQNRIYFTNADGISSEVTNEKYAKADEKELSLSACHDAIFKRVAKGAAQAEKNVKKRNQIEQSFYNLMASGYGVGGGRIMSNCGTDVGGTMINCFVQGIGDSITECEDETAPGIYVALAKAAESMRRGGGVGYNFSKIRPEGAYVKGTGSEASGPCSYINVFDTSCRTVESAGCFAGETLINTTEGLVTVKEIVESDKDWIVNTHLGPKRVTTKFRNGIKEVWNVYTTHGYHLRVTPEHKFAQIENGKIITRSIKDIHFSKKREILLLTPRGVTVDPTWSLEEKEAWLIGQFQGNGCWVWNDEKTLVKGITIANNTTKQDVIDRIVQFASDLGLNPKVHKRENENCVNVAVYNVDFFRNWFARGIEKGEHMPVPGFILKSPETVRAAYIAGLLDADGCVSETKSNIRIRMTSELLLKHVQVMLTAFGIPTSVKIEREAVNNWKTIHCLGIYGGLAQRRFNNTVGKFAVKTLQNLATRDRVGYGHSWNSIKQFCDQKSLFSKYWHGNEFTHPNVSASAVEAVLDFPELINTTTVEVRYVTVEPCMQETYDLEVEDVHLLSGDGVYTSNSRRGAQLGALYIYHPDIEEFIYAKREEGRWENFNVSVAVTDKFMEAVRDDTDWELYHVAEPCARLKKERGNKCYYKPEENVWVYDVVRARDLWEKIMKSTYDYAEPGILYIDVINRLNNLNYCELIEATNPCVTADTWVHTSEGPRRVSDLIGVNFKARVDGIDYDTGNGFFETGYQQVYKLTTKEGYTLRATEKHKVCVLINGQRTWLQVNELQPGMQLVLNNHDQAIEWQGAGSNTEGYLLGTLLGDGWFNGNNALICAHPEAEPEGIMSAVEASFNGVKKSALHNGWSKVVNGIGKTQYRFKSTELKNIADKFGMYPEKTISDEIEKASSSFYIGFLRGIFDTDGSVQLTKDKGVSIRLNQSNMGTLQAIQRMLARLGVMSKIYRNRYPEMVRSLPDGNGGSKAYRCKANHDLVISKSNVNAFIDRIGFSDTVNFKKIASITNSFYSEKFVARLEEIIPDGQETVYDVTVDNVHAFDANGLYIHNCGEQPLQSDGCCDLGPLFLHKFVVNPFTPEAYFNKSEFEKAVRVQVRFLDNILDVTLWPHKSQKDQARLKRRIGLGFSGLGTALIMLGVRYNSHEGRDVAEMIAKTMAEAAYNASIDLAKEKGAFPAFDADKYLAKGTFASTLPLEIQSRIREYGIRNSHLISIAPTGTVSLAFGDNCTGGLEPMFMVAYKRSKRMADGSRKEFTVVEHALNVWLNKQENNQYAQTIINALVNGETAVTWYGITAPIKTILPSSFVSALEISVDDHMAMVAVIQKYCDSACSKTVNVPENYDYDDFKGLYFRAWEAGLKGLSTYRPNPTRQGILNAITPETPEATEAPKVEEVIAEKMDKIEAQFKRPVLNTERLRDIAKELASRYGALYENYMHNRIDDCPHGSGSAIRFYQKVHTHEDHISVLGHVAYQKVEIFDWQTGFQFTFRRPYEVAITSSGSTSDWCNFAGRNWSMLARSDVKDLIKALHSTKNVRNDNGSIRFGTQDSGKPRFHRSEAAVFAYIVNRSLVDKGIFSKDYTLATAEEVIYAEILEYERRRVTGYETFKAKVTIDSIHSVLCDGIGWPEVTKRSYEEWTSPEGNPVSAVDQMLSNQESAAMALMGEAFHHLGDMISDAAKVQEQTQVKTVDHRQVASGTGLKCPECHTNNLVKRDGCKVCTSCGYEGSCG